MYHVGTEKRGIKIKEKKIILEREMENNDE